MFSAAEPPPTNVINIVKSIINLGGDAAALSSRQQGLLVNSLVVRSDLGFHLHHIGLLADYHTHSSPAPLSTSSTLDRNIVFILLETRMHWQREYGEFECE